MTDPTALLARYKAIAARIVVPCQECDGDGRYSASKRGSDGYERCPACQGEGKVRPLMAPCPQEREHIQGECGACNMSGEVPIYYEDHYGERVVPLDLLLKAALTAGFAPAVVHSGQFVVWNAWMRTDQTALEAQDPTEAVIAALEAALEAKR